jgi:hypothetical protein
MKEQIENNFRHHGPAEGQAEKYVEIRARAKAFALDGFCPDIWEESLVIAKLEEAVKRANASIARNG